MFASRTCLLRTTLLLFGAAISLVGKAATTAAWRFDFGSELAAPGYTVVTPAIVYTPERGFGFEPGAELTAIDRGGSDALRRDAITSKRPFFFTVNLPEGNYDVTLTLGDANAETTTTVKAELRRLMLENVHTAAGAFATRTFTVNVRRPQIAAVNGVAAGTVTLKVPRETTQEAWAWDERLTLEFSGTRPTVCALEITPSAVPTLFLLGDSTVTDQSREPYNSWGQMLPRWFKPGIAVANHGESGETYRDSIGRRRLDKILSVLKPGDTVLMQFGHNDQKQIAQGSGGPFTTYKQEIKTHVDAIRARGGVPVVVSPMERREFNADGKIVPSLADYAAAAQQATTECGVAFIDLHTMSIAFYEALGPENSKAAFALPKSGKLDATHHSNYGSYELSKCIVTGIQRANLAAAKYVSDDFGTYDPAHPDPIETFAVPPSPLVTTQRPLGDTPPGGGESHKN